MVGPPCTLRPAKYRSTSQARASAFGFRCFIIDFDDRHGFGSSITAVR
jgi:hypothetical protein